MAQAFYNREEGVTTLSIETGAGQWGSSLAFAGSLFGLDVSVYMVKVSYQQKPYHRDMMETHGARCVASPSEETEAGRAILAKDPDTTGSLGIAISEAVEVAATNDHIKYALGSVLNHVMLRQTVISQEAMAQMEMAGDYPDIVIGCAGGGSNFAGIAFPFLGAKFRGGPAPQVIAVEPAACPTMTRGKFAYDFGNTGHLTPLVSHLLDLGEIEARAVYQNPSFEAGLAFARAEGIIPAPEATHAVRAVFDEAMKCKKEGKPRVILFNLSGHDHFDMAA